MDLIPHCTVSLKPLDINWLQCYSCKNHFCSSDAVSFHKCVALDNVKIEIKEEMEMEDGSKLGFEVKDSDIQPFAKEKVTYAIVIDDANKETSNVLNERDRHCGDDGNNRSQISTGSIKNLRKYQCSECSYGSAYKRQLVRHIKRLHENVKLYYCSNCPYGSAYKRQLVLHMEIVHENERPFQCSKCPFFSACPKSLIHHFQVVHEPVKSFQCSKCEFNSSFKHSLSRHISQKHEKKTYQCSMCSFCCNTKEHLNGHVKRSHEIGKHFQCLRCPFQSIFKNNLADHLKEVHENKLLSIVEDLENPFGKERVKVKEHRKRSSEASLFPNENNGLTEDNGNFRTENVKTVKEFHCVECTYTTCFESQLWLHKKLVHEMTKRYCCDLCSFRSAYEQCLAGHVREVHLKFGHRKRYQCSQCAFQAYYKHRFAEHLEEFHKNFKYKCSKCTFISATRRPLTKHIKTAH